jgi:hypothetical protein
MEVKSALCIAHGLTHTATLKFIDLHSNPIGKFGMRQILQSVNNNQNTKFKVNMKDISADKEIVIDKDIKNMQSNFDPSNPEGSYTLDLEESFDQVVL